MDFTNEASHSGRSVSNVVLLPRHAVSSVARIFIIHVIFSDVLIGRYVITSLQIMVCSCAVRSTSNHNGDAFLRVIGGRYFTCLFEQKIIFKQRMRLELLLIYFAKIQKQRNSGKPVCNIETEASK